jgi:hypothetical protein
MTSKTFNQNDYQNKGGMITTVWGPPLWHFLHTMSFNYPSKPTSDEKKQHKVFLESIKFILPCKYCRDNYSSNLKESGYSLKVFQSRTTFSKFIYKLHNRVNKMLGKNIKISYDEVRERYEHFRSRCTEAKIANKKQSGKTDKSSKSSKTNKSSKTSKATGKTNNPSKIVKENGCVKPMYGTKSRCLLRIVPANGNEKTLTISNKCKLKKM